MPDLLADLGTRILATLGEPAARELLDVLTRSETDRATLIGRLSLREDAAWLAELLIEPETDPDDITRMQVVDALCQALQYAEWQRKWQQRQRRPSLGSQNSR